MTWDSFPLMLVIEGEDITGEDEKRCQEEGEKACIISIPSRSGRLVEESETPKEDIRRKEQMLVHGSGKKRRRKGIWL